MKCVFYLIALAIAILSATGVDADELRPAFLNLHETAPDEYSVLWKIPASGDMRLAIYARLPEVCQPKSEPVRGLDSGAYFERWSARCQQPLKGRQIVIEGLSSSSAEVMVRIEYLRGTTEVARLNSGRTTLTVAGDQTVIDVARTYFLLGIEHILTSLDHLLFVLALIVLINDRWMLVKTITAFTAAHSVTLAASAFGLFTLPQKPVEATIALSIAFLASELVKSNPQEKRLSEEYPWIVSFSFGLLHGFGFAGALKEIGLPQLDVPLALLAFNLGVETGQLAFVVAVLAGMTAIRQLYAVPIVPARLTIAYLIGTASMVWLISRVSTF